MSKAKDFSVISRYLNNIKSIKLRKKEFRKEIKKHFQYMTQKEILRFMNLQKKFRKKQPMVDSHAKRRMRERYIPIRDVMVAIKYGGIVEYSCILDKNNFIIDERIMFRSLRPRQYQVVVMYSLRSNSIITVYKKSVEAVPERHKLDIYDKNFDILKVKYIKRD